MKCFAYIFLAVVLAIAFASDLAAQTKACLGPRLNLVRPANSVTEGEKVVFSVSVDIDNFNPTDLKYEWRVFPRGKFATGHETAVADLWHIGASTHPGPGLGAGSGYLVAKQLTRPPITQRLLARIPRRS